MQLPPTSVIANWPEPNYENPHTHGLSLVIINVIFMTLISLAVPLRVYGRYRNKGCLGWDDFTMVIAYTSFISLQSANPLRAAYEIFSLALGIVVILANVRFQWNRHVWDVEFTMFEPASIIALVAKVMFVLAATFTRISLICFYFRLIKDTGHNVFKWILWSAMSYNIAIGIVFFFLSIILCVPVRAYWVFPPINNAKCLDEGPVVLVAGVLNCISDLMVTLLPIPIVMRLNMPLKQRIGVIILLSLGLIVTIAGIVRTYYIWKTLIDSYDETWNSMPLYICATVEIDLAILCGCAPALKPLFAPVVSHVTEMLSSVGHHGSGHSGDAALTRPTTTKTQKFKSRPKKEGDKIPMTSLSTAEGRASDDSKDELNDKYQEATLCVLKNSHSGRRPRSYSHASSQRTILPAYHDNGVIMGVSGWDIRESYEGEDRLERHVSPRRHGDVEKAWDNGWMGSNGNAGWI